MTLHERQFRRLAFIQVLLGLVAFCIAEGRPTLLLIVSALALSAWVLTEGKTPGGLPRPLLNLGALGAVILVALEIRHTAGNQPVALVGHFTMALQVLILFGKKGPREYTQLAVLSPLQMISASVLPGGVTLVYGLLLVVYCMVTLMTAVANQVKRTGDLVHRRHTRAASDMGDPMRHDTITGSRYRLQRHAAVLAMGIGCGAVAVAVFMAVPRTKQGRIAESITRPTGTQVTGYSDEISLTGGAIGEGSREPVLNVRLTHDGEALGADREAWLIRGAVLTHYEPATRRWTRSPVQIRGDLTVNDAHRGVRLAPQTHGRLVKAEVTLRRQAERTLFVPVPADGPIGLTAIKTPAVNRVTFGTLNLHLSAAAPEASVHTYSLELQTQHPTDYRHRYPRRGPMGPGVARDTPGPGAAPPPAHRNAARWSVGRVEIAAMARRVLRDKGLPTDLSEADPDTRLQAGRALADHLRSGYRYTTQNPPAGETDPILAFLFQQRAGHCELFASGLCAMCRSVGLPAAVATGFRASEYNEIGGYYTVRQAHAHAWTEIDLGDGIGWHTLDATPAAEVNRQHAAPTGWSARLRDFYDHLEFGWIASVITYDRDAQHGLVAQAAEFITRGPDRWADDLGGWLDKQSHLFELDVLGYVVLGVILVALIVSVVSLIRLLIERHRRMVALQLTALPRGQRRGLARQLRFYIAMLETLERHGLIRPPWQSPFGYAQELAETDPMRFDPVVALTEIFYEVRFGHRQLDDDRRQRIKAHLRRLEHTLAEVRVKG